MKTTLAILLLLTAFSCANSGTTEKTPIPPVFLTPGYDTTGLVKTADMLDEDKFWTIVDRSLQGSPTQDEQELRLIADIGKLSPKEMIGFRLRTDKLLYDTYTSAMWCAGYIMNGGCSDDCFEYFRCWIISRGKDVYYKAVSNPDNLVGQVKPGARPYEFELFWYVALEAFYRKTGKQLYDYIDNDNFKTCEGNYPRIKFTWKEEDPETWRKLCPKLYARFN